jgi:hypothetical protein
MKKYFGRESRPRIVPKCKECKTDKEVCLSTYNIGKGKTEKYWECFNCYSVVRKAKN